MKTSSIRMTGVALLAMMLVSFAGGGAAFAGGRSSRVENALEAADTNKDIMPVAPFSDSGASNKNSLLSDADALSRNVSELSNDAMMASEGIVYGTKTTGLTLHEPGKGGPTSGAAPVKTGSSFEMERIPGDTKIIETIDDGNGKITFRFDNGDTYVLIIENWAEIKQQAGTQAADLATQFMFDGNLHAIWEGTVASSREAYISGVRNDKVNELWYDYAESRGLGHMYSWQRSILDPNDGVTWVGSETVYQWYGPSPVVTEDFDPFAAADAFMSENESSIGSAADAFSRGEGREAVSSYVEENAQGYGWNDWTSIVFADTFAVTYSSERSSLDSTDPFDAGAAMDRIIGDTAAQVADVFAKEKAAEATAAGDNPYYARWYTVKLAEFTTSDAAMNLTAAQASYDNAKGDADSYARQFGLPGSEAYDKARKDYDANILAPLKADLDAAQAGMEASAQRLDQAARAAADEAAAMTSLEPSEDYAGAENELKAAREARDKIENDAWNYASGFPVSADDTSARDEAYQNYKDENGFADAQERVQNAEADFASQQRAYQSDLAAAKADAWVNEYSLQKSLQTMDIPADFTAAQDAYDAALADKDSTVAAAANDLIGSYGNAYDEFLGPLKSDLDAAKSAYDLGLADVDSKAKSAAWDEVYNEFYNSVYDSAEGYFSYTLEGEQTWDNWQDYIGVVSSINGSGPFIQGFGGDAGEKLVQLEQAYSAELDAIARGRAEDAANKAYSDAVAEAARQMESFASQYINDAYSRYVNQLVTDAMNSQKNTEIDASLPQIIDEINARNTIEIPSPQDTIFTQPVPDVYLVWEMVLAIGPEAAGGSAMEDIETSPYDIYEISDLELPDGGLIFTINLEDEAFLASSGAGDEISEMIWTEELSLSANTGRSDTLAALMEKFEDETNPQKKEFLETAIWALANMQNAEDGAHDGELERLNDEMVRIIVAVDSLSEIMNKGELGRLTDIFNKMSAAKDRAILTYGTAVEAYYADIAGEFAKHAVVMKTKGLLSEKLTGEAIVKLSPRDIDAIIEKIKASGDRSKVEDDLLKLESQLRARYEVDLKKKAFTLEMKRVLRKYTLEITSLLYDAGAMRNTPDKAESRKTPESIISLPYKT